MAKRSGAMYEASISFLRRSTAPEIGSSAEPEPKQKRKSTRKDILSSTPRPDATRTDSHPDVRPRSPAGDALAVKTGSRDGKDMKRQDQVADTALFKDAAATLRGILQADAVAIVDMDDYHLFIRRTETEDLGSRKVKKPARDTKVNVITDFLQGKEWPADVIPVVHHAPKSNVFGVKVLGSDADPDGHFQFDRPGAEAILGDFLEAWFKTRHFWWDREDVSDTNSQNLMRLMPERSQTILATAFTTYDGKTRFASFASFNRPPSTFGESSIVGLPFVWILGGCTRAAMAIRQMRALEKTQISYSNVQAQ